MVREVDRRRFDDGPLEVWVERDGGWYAGRLHEWLLLDDGAGWMGLVTYSVAVGQRHEGHVPEVRVRPREP